jgi:hypothetical protein
MRGQREFQLTTKAQLVLLVLAAVGGAISWHVGKDEMDYGAVLALIAFALAALIKGFSLTRQADKIWYEGRAAAESIKTLAWRYSVGGEPFRADDSDGERADRRFISRLEDVLQDLHEIRLGGIRGPQITQRMRDLRASPLDQRKSAYETGRIEDQENWYSDKADWNRSRADLWSWTVLAIEIVGLLGAIARVIGWLHFDLLAIAAAATAAATAWLRSKQYEALVSAYSVAAEELADVRSLVAGRDTEETWAAFVEDSEEAISREHTLWRASRGLRRRRWTETNPEE